MKPQRLAISWARPVERSLAIGFKLPSLHQFRFFSSLLRIEYLRHYAPRTTAGVEDDLDLGPFNDVFRNKPALPAQEDDDDLGPFNAVLPPR